MHVLATPLLVELPVGEPARIAVTITNSTALIDAFTVRTFGLDPRWVSVSTPRLSLFPSEVGMVEVSIQLPEDYPAGLRQVAVHVQSENDPAEFSLAQVALDVGTRARTTIRVDPVAFTGGNKATFALVVANDGNSTVQARPEGVDPEDVVEIGFEPPTVVLPPGRREVVQANVQGGRPWFGQPKPRVLSFSLGPDSPPAMATFVQRPRIGRWLISLLGLVTVAAIFASVLSRVIDNVVDESQVDSQVIDQALSTGDGADDAQVSVQAITISATVVLANGAPVPGVQADLYRNDNGTVPVATAATDAAGAFTFGRLPAGTYRLKITGGGFSEQWYQGATTFADAKDIEVEAGSPPPELEPIALGGRPGSVRGEVVVDDPTGATARLVVTGVADPDTDAVVEEVPVSADGSFLFEEVPSPASYELIVDKPGFATESRGVVLRAAQDLDGIEVVLREGDGVVSGRVQGPNGALGGVTIAATDGTVTVSTVSLTVDDVGFFAVRGLPTPGQYTVTFEREGFTSETRTFDLTSTQPQAGDVVITLAPSTGSLTGTVSLAGEGPVGGVTVTIEGGDVALTTTSASLGDDAGGYVFEQLPVPATYTVTFAKEGLVSQTRLEDLDPLAGTSNATGIDAVLVPATATIGGSVRTAEGDLAVGATVALNNGTETLTVLSADDPRGQYEFARLAPGPYTVSASLPGTTPAIELVTVSAGERAPVDLRLLDQASLFGQVLLLNTETDQYEPFQGAAVRLFPAEVFPGTPAQALQTDIADANGNYEFNGLDAPDDFVVAVYSSATSDEVLDSELIQSIPSFPREVDVFRLESRT